MNLACMVNLDIGGHFLEVLVVAANEHLVLFMAPRYFMVE
jgi:hypothetical protein